MTHCMELPRSQENSVNPMNYLFLAQRTEIGLIIYLGNIKNSRLLLGLGVRDVNDRVTISHERSRARDVLVTPRGLNAQTRPRSTDA